MIASSSRKATRGSSLHGNGFWGLCWPSLAAMKNIYELLHEKEITLLRVRTEVDALRLIAPLLADGSTEPDHDQAARQPDRAWTPTLERNKWPSKTGDPARTYSDS
jgi:hypothetical protein